MHAVYTVIACLFCSQATHDIKESPEERERESDGNWGFAAELHFKDENGIWEMEFELGNRIQLKKTGKLN